MAKSKKAAAARAQKRRPTKTRRIVAGGKRRGYAAKKSVPVQQETKKSTKIASMTVLLCRIKGVSIDELCKQTGWQPHSVRAVISSVMKKKLGLEVVSEKVGGVRIYRVVV